MAGGPLSQAKGNSISRRLLPSSSKIWDDTNVGRRCKDRHDPVG